MCLCNYIVYWWVRVGCIVTTADNDVNRCKVAWAVGGNVMGVNIGSYNNKMITPFWCMGHDEEENYHSECNQDFNIEYIECKEYKE